MKDDKKSGSESNVYRFPTGGGNDGGGTMDDLGARVAKVEASVQAVEVSLAKVGTRLDYLATKEDVASSRSSVVLWVVGTVFVAQILPSLLSFAQRFLGK